MKAGNRDPLRHPKGGPGAAFAAELSVSQGGAQGPDHFLLPPRLSHNIPKDPMSRV